MEEGHAHPPPGPRDRGARRPRVRWLLVVVLLAVLAVVLAGVGLVLVNGGTHPTVRITSVRLSDASGNITGSSPTGTSFSTAAGSSVTVEVDVSDDQPDGLEMCVTGATISPSTFAVSAVDPPNICLFGSAVNGSAPAPTPLYFGLAVPGTAFDGSVTIVLQDYGAEATS